MNLVVLAARKVGIPRHEPAAAHEGKRRISDLLRIPGFRLVFIVSGTLSMTWDLFAFVMALLYEKAPAGRGAEVLSVRTWIINFCQTSVPLASGALGAALGMLPVFWAMGASLLVAGWFATRAK